MLKLLVAAVSLTAATCVQAQVQIVESRPLKSPAQAAAVQTSNSQTELFYQLQVLQQEVQELRGLVEVQSYEIKRLKQQRLDDYVDLDRRIVALGGGSIKASDKPATAVAPKAEKQVYDQALVLLRERKVDESVAAFNQYLADYPDGQYAANANYWLGETYLLQGELEDARQSFTLLMDSYPQHRKAEDARYKLGTVYDRLGDKAKAKSLLQEAAKGESSSARLARKYLEKNFAN